MELQRYRYVHGLIPDSNGDWVKYADLWVETDTAKGPPERESVLRQDEYGRCRFVPKPIELLARFFYSTPSERDTTQSLVVKINELVAAVNAIREGQ